MPLALVDNANSGNLVVTGARQLPRKRIAIRKKRRRVYSIYCTDSSSFFISVRE
jgi:hypothetical protein